MTTDPLADAIAVSLNVEREAAGWTLDELAGELGLSTQTLGRYLTRRTRSMPLDVLTRACAIIGVPVGVVISQAEERAKRAEAAKPDEVREKARGIVREARERARAEAAAPDVDTEQTRRNMRSTKRGT